VTELRVAAAAATAAPRARRRPLRLGGWPGMLVAALFVLPPLLWLAAAMGEALLHSGPAVFDRISRALLGRSLLLAGTGALLAAALGVPYGWLTARYHLPARPLLLLASLLPVLLPPYAAGYAWMVLFSKEGALNAALLRWGWVRAPIEPFGSWLAAAVVLAFCYWPILAWLTHLSARAVPRSLDDTARLALPDGAAARWAAAPLLRAALPAGALLVFLLALADFGVENGLQVRVYPVEIVNAFQKDWNAGQVARLALPLVAAILALVMLQLRCLERTPVEGSAEPVTHLLPGALPRWGGAAFCVGVLAFSFAVPFGVLIASSLPLSTYPEVWAESADHFGNTLVTAGGGALLAVAIALLYGWHARGRRLAGLDLALTLPYALPASLIGIAMIQLLNRPGLPGWLYGSLGGLVWLYVALFYPFAHKALQPAWARVDPELLDEAAVAGAGGWTRFGVVAWPAVRGYAAAGGALVAVLSAREMDATALLRVPGGDTLAFRIQDYLHFAPGPNVSALCVLVVALSAAVVGSVAAWAWRAEG
jgi:iron(III) transport system permease protein